MTQTEPTIPALDDGIDHVRGGAVDRLILVYGDFECPYTRAAVHQIDRVRRQQNVRYAFRHFPLTEIHPHARAAAAAAEAAALQQRFWEMHDLLFRRQTALEDDDLRRYAGEVGLDRPRFDVDRAGAAVLGRIRRDVDGGLASGQVQGTPTLVIEGVVYRGDYDAASLAEVLAR